MVHVTDHAAIRFRQRVDLTLKNPMPMIDHLCRTGIPATDGLLEMMGVRRKRGGSYIYNVYQDCNGRYVGLILAIMNGCDVVTIYTDDKGPGNDES